MSLASCSSCHHLNLCDSLLPYPSSSLTRALRNRPSAGDLPPALAALLPGAVLGAWGAEQVERLVLPALPLCTGSTAPVVLLARWAVPTALAPILPACHPGHEPKVQIHSEPQSWGLERDQSMDLSSLGACYSGFAWLPALRGRQWLGRGTDGHMGSSEGFVGWECRAGTSALYPCPTSAKNGLAQNLAAATL